MNKLSDKQKTARRNEIIFLIASVVVLLLLLLFLRSCDTNTEPTTEKYARTVTLPSVSATEPSQKQTAIGCFDYLYMVSNKKEQTVHFENPRQNDCIMNFALMVYSDNGESTLLWHTEDIVPGTVINRITINKSLNKGTYNAELVCSCFDIDSRSKLNGASVHFTLIVN